MSEPGRIPRDAVFTLGDGLNIDGPTCGCLLVRNPVNRLEVGWMPCRHHRATPDLLEVVADLAREKDVLDALVRKAQAALPQEGEW